MKNLGGALCVAFGLIVGIVYAAEARHSDARHCADDYRRFCNEWGLETRGLENCMRRHGDRLTNACVGSLLRAGLVTQAEVDRRRAALGREKAAHLAVMRWRADWLGSIGGRRIRKWGGR